MGEQEIIQIAFDGKTIAAVAGAAFLVIAFLLVALAKVIVNGINKSIITCAAHLEDKHDNLKEKHSNHEIRIVNLEKAIFIPIKGHHNE